MLERRNAGTLERRNAGTPERRNAGTPEYLNPERRNTKTRNTELLKPRAHKKILNVGLLKPGTPPQKKKWKTSFGILKAGIHMNLSEILGSLKRD